MREKIYKGPNSSHILTSSSMSDVYDSPSRSYGSCPRSYVTANNSRRYVAESSPSRDEVNRSEVRSGLNGEMYQSVKQSFPQNFKLSLKQSFNASTKPPLRRSGSGKKTDDIPRCFYWPNVDPECPCLNCEKRKALSPRKQTKPDSPPRASFSQIRRNMVCPLSSRNSGLISL